ncbi:radical SAM protein [Infirmifilum sp. SLHALR2]|nr:MAG: radical SAM protein [Thermofilum sp. NZ13]
MTSNGAEIVFGPVPSRRLGRSLGVNNIPAKTCTYSCVYCQLGRTVKLEVSRRAFYDPVRIIETVRDKLREAEVDYVTFVPDGEPTLDARLGAEVKGIRELGARVAVLTNASLLWMEDVRRDLEEVDLVSVKVDAARAVTWRRVNRPHPSLRFDEVVEGMETFAKGFRGTLISETMLVRGLGQMDEIEEIASTVRRLGVSRAYIAVPTRPPAESWVEPPPEQDVLRAYRVFSEKLGEERVGLLLGFAEGEFGSGANPREELLGILAVHPMKRSEVERYLNRAGVGMELVEQLIASGEVVRLSYMGEEFYMRKLPGR